MTQESFERIKAAALAMADEVEWADFPLVDAAAQGATRKIFAHLVTLPLFAEAVRRVLGQMFERVQPIVPSMPDHQEPEQQAGGMVQAAMKSVVCQAFPEIQPLYHELLRVKFRKLEAPMIQAPAGVLNVPSMATQRRRARIEGLQ